jgi:hypothetical protein
MRQGKCAKFSALRYIHEFFNWEEEGGGRGWGIT